MPKNRLYEYFGITHKGQKFHDHISSTKVQIRKVKKEIKDQGRIDPDNCALFKIRGVKK